MNLNDDDLEEYKMLKINMELKKKQVLDKMKGYNEKLRSANSSLQEALNAYNKVVADVESFTEDVGARQQIYYDNKGSAWRQNEFGEDYETWMKAWATLPLNTVELDLPEELVEDDFDFSAVDSINMLPLKRFTNG